MSKRKKVVILGAGYAGLATAHKLQHITNPREVEIVLIERNTFHTNCVSLHEIAMGNAQAQDISYDIVPVLQKPHVEFLRAEVEGVDKETKVVKTDKGDVSYDILVMGLGFEPETFGIDGMLDNAFQVYDLHGSEYIVMHMENQFRRYAFAPCGQKDESDITIIIGGAGFTGIELLGELVDRIPRICRKYHINKRRVKIYCVEAAPVMLPMFNAQEVAYVRGYLESRGVEFLLNTPIVGSTPNGFLIKRNGVEEELRASTSIWTAGVRGNHLMEEIFGDAVKRGRLIVNQDLTAPGHPDIYVLGDCAAFIGEGQERPYPTTAQIAAQMGRHAASNIRAQIRGRKTRPFVYDYKGTVCSLGPRNGVADLNGLIIKGFWALRIKRLVESKSDWQISGMYNAIKNNRLFKFFNH